MSRGKATNDAIRILIVKMFHEGRTFRDIAEKLNVAKSTVADIIKKFGETGSTKVSRENVGRPRKISPRMQRSLVRICKINRRSTVRNLTALWNHETTENVSRETCRRWIHKSGLSFYKVRKFELNLTQLYFKLIRLGKREAVAYRKTKEKTIKLGKDSKALDC